MHGLKYFAGTLRQLIAGRTDIAFPLPQPAHPICIVGDLHGRLDLLEQMLAQIARHPDAGTHRVIFAGDMIDRGSESAQVLNRLHALTQTDPQRIICLMGNHERMMLDFMADPQRHGPRWLASGGNETLTSFGLSPWTRKGALNTAEHMATLATSLAAVMPAGLADWLTALPLVWCEGTLAVTHAGADPTCPIADQPPEVFLWGHPAFLRQTRTDGIWIAHGHTIVAEAKAEAGRISVDTGAWRTDRLSAAWISRTGIDFIETSREQP